MTEALCPGPTTADIGVGVLTIIGRRMSVPPGLVNIDQKTILTMGCVVRVRRNDGFDVWRDELRARNTNG